MSAIQLFDLNGEQRFTGTSVGGAVLATTVTVTNAQIKALPTTPAVLVPATVTLAYSGLPPTLPIVVAATAFLDSRAGGYTNLDASTTLSVAWGSDQSVNVARASAGGGADAAILSVFQATSVRWLAFPLTDRDADSQIDGGLQDNSLVLAMNNAGLGALTGGNAANKLTMFLRYATFAF